MSKKIILQTPSNFSFRHTVYSHGWYQLLPFQINEATNRLSCVFGGINYKKPILVIISELKGKVEIKLPENEMDEKQSEQIIGDVRHILRFDDDLDEFYEFIKAESTLRWVYAQKAGRLLRSPTVWEDLVKTICTTNCSWALTKKMTANLVQKLGEETLTGERAFPTAEKMASFPTDFYRDEIRAGYRAVYFAELAENVANGKINPESWLNSTLPTKELKNEMKQIKGVGDYAAENLLKLVGRYDGLALDSWLRSQFYKKYNAEQICEDQRIREHYQRFGKWSGLAIWCDMTERWFLEKD